MELATTGAVLQIQGFSVNDGEGIRTTIFLPGCPLRCQWCSNPETWTIAPKLAVYAHKCMQCRTCEKSCPKGLFPAAIHIPDRIDRTKRTGGASIISRQHKKDTIATTDTMVKVGKVHKGETTSPCTACGTCVEACPHGALTVLIQTMSVDDIMTTVERDAIFFRASGGGVTLSGGEPTFQRPFLRALVQRLYDSGISLTMETCGYFDWEATKDILEKLDHVFLDIKHMDPLVHKQLTGVSNEIILENARHIHALKIPLTIRIPVIPRYTGTVANLRATADFMADQLPHASIELLPYHNLGREKYQALGLSIVGQDEFIVPENNFMTEAEAIFTAKKIPVKHYR